MKFIILLCILFIAHITKAQDEQSYSPCIQTTAKSQLDYLNDLEKHIEWFGASDHEIMNAPCKSNKLPTLIEMKKFISSKALPDNSQWGWAKSLIGPLNKPINGVQFKKESPVMIEAFSKLTTAMDVFGIFPNENKQIDFQALKNINPECEKVLCAVEKIWGEALGDKILYTLLKHNFNTSEYAFDNSDRFNEKEINDVMLALEDLPKGMIPLGSENQRLTHFKRGYTLSSNGPGVLANAVIMLFDEWSTSPRIERQYTTFHELSHNIGTHFNKIDLSPGWLSLSHWIKKGDDWSKSSKACFASEYGLTNPAEDWAESVTAFRYNGANFQKKCPEKFNFIKKYAFNGLEYTSASSCPKSGEI